MKTNKFISIKIDIDYENNQISVESEKEIIQKKLTIYFNKNEIETGKENENSISILTIKENDKISINYNHKEYQLTQEELLAI